jgi:hypothetical protein
VVIPIFTGASPHDLTLCSRECMSILPDRSAFHCRPGGLDFVTEPRGLEGWKSSPKILKTTPVWLKILMGGR